MQVLADSSGDKFYLFQVLCVIAACAVETAEKVVVVDVEVVVAAMVVVVDVALVMIKVLNGVVNVVLAMIKEVKGMIMLLNPPALAVMSSVYIVLSIL